MSLLALAILSLPNLSFHRGQEVTGPNYPEPIFAGMREIALGPVEYPSTVLGIVFAKDYPSVPTSHGYTMEEHVEKPLGSAIWSVKADTFGSTACVALRMDATYQEDRVFEFKNSPRRVRLYYPVRGTSTWWIAKDGTILRQYERREDERGVRTANCTYGADRIEVTIEEFGKRRIATAFPGDMAKVQAQFKPMLVGGKPVLKEKEFLSFNPFANQFDRHRAKLAGLFRADLMGVKFAGRNVDVDGYPDGTRRAYLSNEGDIVRVDLPADRMMTISSIPPGKAK